MWQNLAISLCCYTSAYSTVKSRAVQYNEVQSCAARHLLCCDFCDFWGNIILSRGHICTAWINILLVGIKYILTREIRANRLATQCSSFCKSLIRIWLQRTLHVERPQGKLPLYFLCLAKNFLFLQWSLSIMYSSIPCSTSGVMIICRPLIAV